MRLRIWVLTSLLLVLSHPSMAAPLLVPSASGGIIDRQLESEYEVKPLDPHKAAPDIDVELPEEELAVPDGEKIEVKRIEIAGNSIISEHLLLKVAARYQGAQMSMRDIQILCREIQQLYVEKGYFLVRVFPPVQVVKEGVLKITVLEVTIGAIQIEGNKHYTAKFIRKFFSKFEGRCIQYNDLVKKILLLNEFSDLNAGVAFQKGQVPGTTDMIVRVIDGRPLHFYADYNNYGSSVTALKRTGARAEFGNTLIDGDGLTLIGVMGFPYKNLQFIDAIYTLPLNANGTSMEFAALHSNFHVNRLEPLHLKGDTLDVTVGISQAMKRTRRMSTTLFANFDYLDVRNYQQHHLSSNDALRILSMGGKFDSLDGLRGRNFGFLELSIGIPSFLEGLKPVDSLCSRKDAGGRFGFMSASYQRLQPMPWHWTLFLNFQGQLAFCRLPISQEFYIGGITTVRGFPNASALGDSGFAVNVEGRIPAPFFRSSKMPWSRKKWGDVFHLITFVDHGEVYVISGHGVVGQTGRVYMTSVGVGARIFAPWGIDVNLDWGFPLSHQERSSDSIFYMKVSKRFL